MRPIKKLLGFLLILVIFGGAAAFIIYYFKNKEKKEITYDLRKNSNGSYIELSGGVTHYELDGPDSGKVVVLIHGFSVPYYIWNGTYEHLVEQGFRVLRYDEFGRGFSDRPDVVYDKALYMVQLKELIEKLNLKQPVDLMGISFGGAVATDFTCAYPEMVHKVVLIDPAYTFEKPTGPEWYTEYKEAVNPDGRANSQLEDFYFPDRHPNWVDQYTPQMEYKGFRHALVSTRYNYPYNGKESSACLNSKNKPVLLVWGKQDKTTPFAQSDGLRSVLKTEFLPVDNAGHLSYLDQPDIVNPALVTFLMK